MTNGVTPQIDGLDDGGKKDLGEVTSNQAVKPRPKPRKKSEPNATSSTSKETKGKKIEVKDDTTSSKGVLKGEHYFFQKHKYSFH